MYLRNRPLDRDEVVIAGTLGLKIRTLPIAVCPPDEYGDPRIIRELVEPLFEELKKAHADHFSWEAREEFMREMMARGGYDSRVMQIREEQKIALKPEFPEPRAYRVCRHCDQKFAYVWGAERIRYCSNACIDAGKVATSKAANGVLVRSRSASRENRRVENNSKCAQCGSAMKAERTTKRYCSAKCKVAAHRA